MEQHTIKLSNQMIGKNAEITLRLSLIHEIIDDTLVDWSRFLNTKDRWMANVVMGTQN